VTTGKEDYNLTPFFLRPLIEIGEIAYRHEVMKDLEDPRLFDRIGRFAGAMQEMRRHLEQASLSRADPWRHVEDRQRDEVTMPESQRQSGGGRLALIPYKLPSTRVGLVFPGHEGADGPFRVSSTAWWSLPIFRPQFDFAEMRESLAGSHRSVPVCSRDPYPRANRERRKLAPTGS